jgi:hypothetical protein
MNRLTAKNQSTLRMHTSSSARSHGAGAGGQRRAEGSVDDVQALGVGERPLGDDQGNQAQRDGAGEQPGRARWGVGVVGVTNQADHGRAGRGDGQGDGEVAQEPGRHRRAAGPRRPSPDEVEVDPPEPESDDQGDHPGRDRLDVASCSDRPSMTPNTRRGR